MKNWNKDWNTWREGLKKGKQPTKEDFNKQIVKMNERYAEQLKGALPTSKSYQEWGNLSEKELAAETKAMAAEKKMVEAGGGKYVASLGAGMKMEGEAASFFARNAGIAGKLAGHMAFGLTIYMAMSDFREGGFNKAGRGIVMADEVEASVTWGAKAIGTAIENGPLGAPFDPSRNGVGDAVGEYEREAAGN